MKKFLIVLLTVFTLPLFAEPIKISDDEGEYQIINNYPFNVLVKWDANYYQTRYEMEADRKCYRTYYAPDNQVRIYCGILPVGGTVGVAGHNFTSLGTPPPEITSSLTAIATINLNFNYQITASGSDPKTFTCSNLPGTLNINTTTGEITGTFTTAQIYNLNIGVSNADGSDSKTLVVTVTSLEYLPDEEEELSVTVTDPGVITNLTGNEDGNNIDNDDDVPTLNQIKQILWDNQFKNTEELNKVRLEINKLRLMQFNQMNQLINLIQEQNNNQGNNAVDDLNDPQAGSLSFTVPANVQFDELGDHTELSSTDNLESNINNSPTVSGIKDKLTEIQNYSSTGNEYIKFTFSELHPSLSDVNISFTENPTLNMVRLAIYGSLSVIIWIYGMILFWKITAPVFDIATYLGG